MSLDIQLTAPNGRKYAQPTGLFINNRWVKSSDGGKITSINPTYVDSLTLVLATELTG
jgi:aldehyde dehydrogenase (NAD(P)+)